jgi:hypothetical protein
MACVTVLVGQCGNQLGCDMFTAIARAAADSGDVAFQHAVSSTFFRRGRSGHPPIARCVLVDMEPKVIAECRKRAEATGLYELGTDAATVTKEDGSGNNWAYGYYGQGASKRTSVAEKLRKECGAADSLAAVHIVHSVAGGTGSGVGCLIADIVREEYPDLPLLHSVVWPFAQGEVMTQWINATLALNVLDETADAIFVLANDDAQQAVAKAVAGGSLPTVLKLMNLPNTPAAHAFAAINHLLSLQLASFVLPRFAVTVPAPQAQEPKKASRLAVPTSSVAPVVGYRCPATIHDNILAVALNPRRKFFHAVTSPVPIFSTKADMPLGGVANGWRTNVADALRLCVRAGSESTLLILRGPEAMTEGLAAVAPSLAQHNQPLHGLHVSNVRLSATLPGPCATAYHASDAFGNTIHRCVEKVERFFEVGAYVHHYERYGVDTDTLEDALLHCWSIADAYGLRPEDPDDDIS